MHWTREGGFQWLWIEIDHREEREDWRKRRAGEGHKEAGGGVREGGEEEAEGDGGVGEAEDGVRQAVGAAEDELVCGDAGSASEDGEYEEEIPPISFG